MPIKTNERVTNPTFAETFEELMWTVIINTAPSVSIKGLSKATQSLSA